MKKDNHGFTLVELLAVIVILAIIMIIAIPAVLNTMESARKKTFLEYIDKVGTTAQSKFVSDQLKGELTISSNIVYDVNKDLDLSNTGKFKGYVLVNDKSEVFITLHDEQYAVYGVKWSDINNSPTYSISEVSDDLLTKEKLASLAGVSSITYIENGIYNSDSIPVKKAILAPGHEINSKMKTLANGKTVSSTSDDLIIEHIKYTRDIIHAPSDKQLISASTTDVPIYLWWEDKIKTIYIGCENEKVYLNTDSSLQYNKIKNVIDIDVSHFLSDDATTLYRFFGECSNLSSVDVRHFNTSKVTNFRGLFIGLYRITELDVSNFDTSQATHIGYMFSDLSLIKSLDLSRFDTSNVIDFEYFIRNCPLLKELHLESFDTSNATTMTSMFSNNSNLEKIYVSNKFITNNVTSGDYVFTNCFKLNNAYDKNKTTIQFKSLYLTYV